MELIANAGVARRVFSTQIPTKWGMFEASGFERNVSTGNQPVESVLVLVLGDVTSGVPLVRVHSQCFTGEMLGSLRCDCGGQLEMAMEAIAGEGRGVLVYEYQEGRGIGLKAKLQTYALQDAGFDTVDANQAMGFRADYRDFNLPAAILHKLGIRQVRLLTNNPNKTRALQHAGIEVVEQLPCEVPPTQHSLRYLRAKKEKMGHALALEPGLQPEPGAGEFEFARIETAIRELKDGRMIVVVDDEDRENEGDLVMAAEKVTPEAVNFMAKYARGLICVAMTGERLDELELGQMSQDNSALGGTAFTVSIDVKGPGVTTGISAHDRAQTIQAVADANSRPEDFARPGHVFPLRARPGGVLERRGQTEAAVDLSTLAGLHPAGAICEIVNDDGTMARVPDLIRFCRKHELVMITVAELARFRMDLLDDVGVIEAVEGFIPACPGFLVARGAQVSV